MAVVRDSLATDESVHCERREVLMRRWVCRLTRRGSRPRRVHGQENPQAVTMVEMTLTSLDRMMLDRGVPMALIVRFKREAHAHSEST